MNNNSCEQFLKENCIATCKLRGEDGQCISHIHCDQVHISLCMTLRNAYFKGFYDCHELTRKDTKEGNES